MFRRFSAGELHFARFVATEYHEHCLKILIYSRTFWPRVGGQETMMEILAEEFSASGHQVKVVTQVVIELERNQDYEVIRSPTVKSYVQALRWSDVCLCASVSLRGLPPVMITRTPLVISHQICPGSPGHFSIVSELKKIVTRFSSNICCSRAVQSHVLGRSVVIPNSYRAEIFKEYNDVIKDLDIVFVGRLDSIKGVSDLVEAMGHLGQAGFRPRLSIVGDGPERSAIVTKVGELGLGRQVTFTGIKTGSELARFVSRHRVMAVPSRCAEAFGIVALEGIACGCAVVGIALGGLPEAIGPCGVTVPNADVPAMARALRSLLEDDSLRASYCSGAPVHLARHARPNVARSYLNVLESTAGLRFTSCES
jgi:glycogen synthase